MCSVMYSYHECFTLFIVIIVIFVKRHSLKLLHLYLMDVSELRNVEL